MSFESVKKVLQMRTVRVVLVCLAALLLLIAVWRVFFSGEKETYRETELEERLSVLLTEVEGVEGATVMIGEEDGAPVSAVVIIKGEDGILTRLRVTEIVSTALRIEKKSVLVYPA